MQSIEMVEDLLSKSLPEVAELISSRAISSVDLVETYLNRIEEFNPALNAIVTIAPDVLESARRCDSESARGNIIGPLHGIPLTIKDTIATKGIRTTSGSRLRADDVPQHDAPVVTRLKAAGAIILGKTNVPEMAIPYETDNPVFGRTSNPHDLSRTPGGSSGGEAAAIAAGLSPAGIGSDLAGSIRVPAHFCGIAGLKPTTGAVPMEGHLPLATGSLALGASIGPMARRVADLALLFRVIGDKPDTRPLVEAVDELSNVGVAWYTDDGIAPVTDETSAAIKAAAKSLSDAGLEVNEERPPGVSRGSALWIELFSRAASAQLREFYRGRENEAGPLVSNLLRNFESEIDLQGKISKAEKVAAAVLEGERLREDLLRWMKTTHLILAPVGSSPAFEHGARHIDVNGQSISVFRAFSYSQTFNVFGLPTVVVPAGSSATGLPIGVQIIGGPLEERLVLKAAAIVEKSLYSTTRKICKELRVDK
ncbi:MAG TPA: amidase [Pyrinomonadaceae bacterium]|jgi:Asp-tRNA(Asn)/Glu-tRNA(Gln) amidotransferase A subunit family amidase